MRRTFMCIQKWTPTSLRTPGWPPREEALSVQLGRRQGCAS